MVMDFPPDWPDMRFDRKLISRGNRNAQAWRQSYHPRHHDRFRINTSH